MKRSIVLIFTLLVTATAALAQESETWQEKLRRQLANEDVSRVVGSLAGALLGSQFGKGKGRIAAVAVGTFAGYWLGGELSRRLNQRDKVGIAETTERAIATGRNTTWRNPQTGMQTWVSVEDARGGRGGNTSAGSIDQAPALDLVNSYYSPSVNVNVRGGPSTDYPILYSLRRGTLVPVVGRVVQSEWVMVAENGTGSGFVYGPLMELGEDQSQAGFAVRHSMSAGIEPARAEIASSDCRNVKQDVVLQDGTRDTHTFKVCRQPDGSWVEV